MAPAMSTVDQYEAVQESIETLWRVAAEYVGDDLPKATQLVACALGCGWSAEQFRARIEDRLSIQRERRRQIEEEHAIHAALIEQARERARLRLVAVKDAIADEQARAWAQAKADAQQTICPACRSHNLTVPCPMGGRYR